MLSGVGDVLLAWLRDLLGAVSDSVSVVTVVSCLLGCVVAGGEVYALSGTTKHWRFVPPLPPCLVSLLTRVCGDARGDG